MPCLMCGKDRHPELEGVEFTHSMIRLCWLYANNKLKPPPTPSIDKECVRKKQYGPGVALKEIITELEVGQWEGCRCESRAAQMNAWGVEGCKEHRTEIVGWLKESANQLSWLDKLKVAKSLAFSVNLLDPIGSLVDAAIQKASEAEARQKTENLVP